MIEQVPAATAVKVLPDTVQIAVVEDEKLTVKPDEALADNTAVVPTVTAEGCANVMVCETKVTEIDRVTLAAAV